MGETEREQLAVNENEPTVDQDLEWFEERVAIMEVDGGLKPKDAKALAKVLLVAWRKYKETGIYGDIRFDEELDKRGYGRGDCGKPRNPAGRRNGRNPKQQP